MSIAPNGPAAAADGGPPLRILYSFADTLGDTGIGTVAWHTVAGLARRGHDVEVWCSSLGREHPGARRLVETLSAAGVRVPHRALGWERAYRYHDRRVARALRGRAGELDIVHVWPRAALRTAAAARAIGARSVRQSPNCHTAFAYERSARETAALGLRPAKGHTHFAGEESLRRELAEYEAVDVVAVPSEYVRRTFLDRGFPADRLGLHPHGFEPADFPLPAPPGPGRDRGLRALFVGACEPRKGLHYALEAWIASGAAERGSFAVYGGFYPGYREVLAPLLGHPSVRHEDWAPDPSVPMRASDVFVFPSVEEGSAVVTYEAMASGCALAVSDAAGARFTHRCEGLLHQAGDVATLTEHLRLLDGDRDLLQRLRRNAIDARPGLTWDVAAGAMEAIYRQALAARPGATLR